MRLHRGLCVGACLLLAAAGCGTKTKPIGPGGVYSPIITTISSNIEPAARGTANVLTVQVTNLNLLPLKYHWKVQAGTLGADSTNASVTWTPPDSIATYDVTASIEAQEGDKHFFRTMTVHMAVDNEFTRWTKTELTKFDPAPVHGGGALYAEFSNQITGASDAWRIDTPLGIPVQITSGFSSVSSPTPSADKSMFAFAAEKVASEKGPSLYMLPFGGGDTASAVALSRILPEQTLLQNPRFSRSGTVLLYVSDTLSSGFAKPWRRDLSTWTAPTPIFDPNDFNVFLMRFLYANWGPDSTGDGIPDYLISTSTDALGAGNPAGLVIVPASGNASSAALVPFLNDNTMKEPDWSPDGAHIVFAKKNPAGDRDIWIINRNATSLSEAVRVTSGPADDSHPRFNDDGTQIYFISNRVDGYGTTGVNATERRGTDVWSVAHFDRP